MLSAMIRCTNCRVEKIADAFCRDASRKSGRSNKCRACQREYMAAYLADPQRANRQRQRVVKWQNDNRERARAAGMAWRVKNREQHLATRRRRRPKTIEEVINKRLRMGLLRSLREKKGGVKSLSLVGFTREELVRHLELQFSPGMSWENMGEWHIDHIVPLSSFTILGPDDPELRRAWALCNLRPLWASENMRKTNKRTHLI